MWSKKTLGIISHQIQSFQAKASYECEYGYEYVCNTNKKQINTQNEKKSLEKQQRENADLNDIESSAFEWNFSKMAENELDRKYLQLNKHRTLGNRFNEKGHKICIDKKSVLLSFLIHKQALVWCIARTPWYGSQLVGAREACIRNGEAASIS